MKIPRQQSSRTCEMNAGKLCSKTFIETQNLVIAVFHNNGEDLRENQNVKSIIPQDGKARMVPSVSSHQ